MPPADRSTPQIATVAAGLIALVGASCYANSLGGEFVFDDLDAIPGNPTIRSLGTAWDPPPGTTATGRPFLNITLALNYAAGGLDVGGYHAVNVAIHLAAAVVLFTLVRGTLLLPGIAAVFRTRATAVAFAVGLLWVAHPLGTEVAGYVVQRCEGLAALGILLTLYGLLRGAVWADEADRPATDRITLAAQAAAADRAGLAYAGAVAACALGVLSKETAVAAPVAALLYDRAFLAGSVREAVGRRKWVYAGLVSTWGLLALVLGYSGGRGDTAGFATGVSPGQYAAAQPGWVFHYVRLAAWPDRLVFDYGAGVGPADPVAVAAVLALLGLAVALYARRPALGFLPAAAFVLLAPSSSFIPVATQVAAERRAYLPLAAAVTAAVLAAVRLGAALPVAAESRRWGLAVLLTVCVIGLAARTHVRNRDYRTAEALWADTAAKVPDNPRARTNLGRELLAHNHPAQAVDQLRAAVAMAPDDPRPHNLLGFALVARGDAAAAVGQFREVIRLDPDNPEAVANLGTALLAAGNPGEAIDWYRKAVAARPGDAAATAGLARALQAAG
ncbi:MAG TPA: tetratricopeptide repeat protein, partial [Urbifossiella sp.]|nr:tetratricopeptide repeat protein [Urbifossiella sp.]